MKEIKAIIKPHRLEDVLEELHEHPELPGVTISHVQGFGRKVGRRHSSNKDASVTFGMVNLLKIECVVDDEFLDEILGIIAKAAHTGSPGDGKAFVYEVEEVLTIHDGQRGRRVQ